MGMFRKEEIMSEEEKKFLKIVDLKKGFGSGETRQEVLRGMNFSVAKGEFCVLLGPSGSGKSTPVVGVSSAPIMFSSVLLPEPDSPTTATYSPLGTEKLTSFKALTAVSPLP